MAENKREHYPHYIGIDAQQEQAMLQTLGLEKSEDLFSHIPQECRMQELALEPSQSGPALKERMNQLSKKNRVAINFIGDGLIQFSKPPIAPLVCSIRGLTTAYTPYQPERSQGTLQSLWIYQSLVAQITGFEAINASLYERSTCLHEAINCSVRMQRNKKRTIIVADNIYPGDKEVLETLTKFTNVKIIYASVDTSTSKVDIAKLEETFASDKDIAAFAFSQINCFGQIENFDELTDIAKKYDILVIGMVEPFALANSGLKEPAAWGSHAQGADLLVAEGQSLALDLNFGGPGLGIFGVRYNEKNKNAIRSTAGRFIGKTVDQFGNECKSIILSTREQHIRREKATSNICSNQSFVASLAGANLLNWGDKGLEDIFKKARQNAITVAKELTQFEGVSLKFAQEFFNEITLKIEKCDLNQLIEDAAEKGLHIGVNISKRCGIDGQLLLMSFNDMHTARDINKLVHFFKQHFQKGSISDSVADIKEHQKRKSALRIPQFATQELYEYYQKLGKQNLSPDDGVYPLGSCTMKYNPEINDWAASLEGFTQTHPQAPLSSVQGNLEILHSIQEWFKAITGLPAVTTQPVAGAQGELVGLKMFQAYHEDRGEGDQRNIIIIPRSAHGTNPATATMAGYESANVNGKKVGIIELEAQASGEMDFEKLQELVKEHSRNIAGIMVTNPNTAGIFETRFHEMAKLIHSVGGLVYMDGANMNAIAGQVDLAKLGVDAVHNNLHKTWSIPHGGGGPGDAIVAVSERLIDYLPGIQVKKEKDSFTVVRPNKSIGSFHRHYGNFAHKVRAYTYIAALGKEGTLRMSAMAVLSARYLYKKLRSVYEILPAGSEDTPRMHEFILTLNQQTFEKIEKAGTPKVQAIAKIGKLFLDFGFHAPTVAFPEQYGLMIEPTESYTREELDHFAQIVSSIYQTLQDFPQFLLTAPHFTPVGKVDELGANKTPILSEEFSQSLPEVADDKISAQELRNMPFKQLLQEIGKAHELRQS